jgi:hypothetical protein
MPLPLPDMYEDWRDWARACVAWLGEGSSDIIAASLVQTPPIVVLPPDGGDGGAGNVPAPWYPLWMGAGDDLLYLGNNPGLPPTAPDIVFIDTLNIANAAIETAQVAAMAITTPLLAELAVTTAKIVDAAIVTAKILDAAIVTAKIGDLQVVTAKIADLAVNNAKIANLSVDSAKIVDLAVTNAKIGLLAVGTANIMYLAVGNAQIMDASILTAKIGLAQITTALIQNAAIVNALIANLAVGNANIQDLAVTAAKIANAAIGSAQIQDASITSAKITSLIIDKVTTGTLDAVVDMGTGLIRFTIGGFRLVMGKGFGTTNQFIMWFGPAMAEGAMTEGAATFYLKTNGAAYFGGGLSSGAFKNSAVSTTVNHADIAQTGTFGSNGGARTYVAAVDYRWDGVVNVGGSFSGTQSYQLWIEKWNGSIWQNMGNITVGGNHDSFPVGNGEHAIFTIAGSLTVTDNSGGLSVPDLRARVSNFVSPNFSGSLYSVNQSQRLSIQSTEG